MVLEKLKFRFERHFNLPDEKAEVKLMAYEGNKPPIPAVPKEEMAVLIDRALDSGVTGAKVIAAGDIVVRDELAERCKDPGCENYGKSKSCPPNVCGLVLID